eukprot:SAG22_NODE_1959_length_3249_cov_2.004762_3_plen_174_part_00
MWIIDTGNVQVEREHPQRLRVQRVAVITWTWSSAALRLKPVASPQVFGELAVLVQERPGVSLPRMRTAYACLAPSHAESASERPIGEVGHASLFALSYDDVQRLRSESAAIDLAVAKAARAVMTNRPSLFNKQDRFESLDAKLDALDSKLTAQNQLVGSLLEDMAALKTALAK